MTLNEYQRLAMTSCTQSSENFAYMLHNLVGEVGEFSSKVAKEIRKDRMLIDDNELCRRSSEINAENLNGASSSETATIGDMPTIPYKQALLIKRINILEVRAWYNPDRIENVVRMIFHTTANE